MSRGQTDNGQLPKGAAAPADDRFLRLKTKLHQELIAGMDLGAIGTMSEDDLRVEVRRAAEDLSRRSPDLLNLSERERLQTMNFTTVLRRKMESSRQIDQLSSLVFDPVNDRVLRRVELPAHTQLTDSLDYFAHLSLAP